MIGMTGERDLVYGIWREDEGVFIPRQRAEMLATLFDVTTQAKTWGDLRRQLSPELYEFMLQARTDQLDDEDDLDAASDDEPFDVEDYTGGDPSDWPGWPAQEMLGWLPDDLQQQYGSRQDTTVSGDYLALTPTVLDDLAGALTERGYRCTRDDSLVRRASWWD